MEFKITIISVILAAIAIWVLLETKRFKHRILGIMIIVIILMTYFSFTLALRGHPVDLSTLQGIQDAGATYFVWLGSIFGNFKSLTTNAINMDWGLNSSNITNSTAVPLNASNSSG